MSEGFGELRLWQGDGFTRLEVPDVDSGIVADFVVACGEVAAVWGKGDNVAGARVFG